jgi:hypothetical protein
MLSWDAAIGNGEVRRMYYHRASIRAKRGGPGIEELLALVRRRRAPKLPAGWSDGAEFLVGLSDWQLGKKGTPAAVERIVDGIDASVARLKELRRIGRRLDTVVIAGLGDLIENCDGHYAMQTFEVELDMREQRRLGRRLYLYAIDAFRPLAEHVLAPAVAGNHGEHRRDGQSFTSFGDNSDLEIPEGVAEACAANPAAYGNVSFVIPQQTLSLTLDVAGVIVGLAHGHQAKRGGTTVQQKVATWWSGQAFGQRPVGDASVLITAHNHHASIVQYGPRWHIQCGTEDSGSQWWDETVGLGSPPHMTTLVIDSRSPNGWRDYQLV